ncbi:hypothetical protein ACFPOI_37080 [Nonomuraea angiospora]
MPTRWKPDISLLVAWDTCTPPDY